MAALLDDAVRVQDHAAVVLQTLHLPRVHGAHARVLRQHGAHLLDQAVRTDHADRPADLREQRRDDCRQRVKTGVLEQQRLDAGRADRGRGLQIRVDAREQPRGQGGDLGAGAVVRRELHLAQAAAPEHGGQGVADLLDVGPGRLHPVPDDRPGGAPGTAAEHPPLHRGDVLRLVDDHVGVRPVVPLESDAAGGAAVAVGEGRHARLAGPLVQVVELVPAVVLRLDLDRDLAEQLDQLVVQGRVRRRQRWRLCSRGDAPGRRERLHLGLGQPVARHVAQRDLPRAEQGQDRPGLEHRPGGVERAAERRVAGDPGGEVLAVVGLDPGRLRPALPGAPGQLDQTGREGRAAAVVAARRPGHLGPATGDVGAPHGDRRSPALHLEVLQAPRAAQVADRRTEHLGHPGRALDRDRRRAVPAGHGHAAGQLGQVGEGGQPHARLAQGRQDGADVVDEHG